MDDLKLPDGEWIKVGHVLRFFPSSPVPVEPEPAPKTAAQCGTTAGYARHKRRGEDACLDCLNASRDYTRARRGISETQPLKPHGTHAAFQRHLKNKTEPCDRCVHAERAFQREARREQRARARENREDAA